MAKQLYIVHRKSGLFRGDGNTGYVSLTEAYKYPNNGYPLKYNEEYVFNPKTKVCDLCDKVYWKERLPEGTCHFDTDKEIKLRILFA